MVSIFLLRFKQRWRLAGAALICLVALVVVLIIASGSGLGVHFLGNTTSPRAAAADGPSRTVLPRSSDPNAPIGSASVPASILDRDTPSSGGPRDVAAAQAAWGADEVLRHQNEILAAVSCARQAHNQPPLTLDPALSQTAGAAWLKLVHDHSWSLMDLPGGYALRSVMALDFGAPQAASRCGIGGFDAATLATPSGATAIGIAVFPPQISWDSASAIVLVK